MGEIKKIAGYNLLIMLAYVLLFALDNSLFMSFFVIALHFLITAFTSFVYFASGNKNKGMAYLLTSGILLLIGFSTCYGFLNGFNI